MMRAGTHGLVRAANSSNLIAQLVQLTTGPLGRPELARSTVTGCLFNTCSPLSSLNRSSCRPASTCFTRGQPTALIIGHNKPIPIEKQLAHNTCRRFISALSKTFSAATMTNTQRVILQSHTNQSTTTCIKTTLSTTLNRNHQHSAANNNNVNAKPQIPCSQTISQAPNFRTMAGVQKLATEPTREHIEHIRHSLRELRAKDNDNQDISLVKDNETGIASMCIQSAAKNGISGKMMCDFLDAIEDLSTWTEGKGLIIYGHKGFFCSGGDLVTVKEMANYEDGLKMATLMQYNLARLQSLPLITMALIQGKALGGGAEIAVTADLRAISKSAKMGYVHCRVGICAAWGGGSRLVQLVGPSRAVELMSSGRLVGAEEALSMGLVNNIIDDADLSDEQVLEKAKAYLKSHLVGAKSTIIAMKGLVNAARTLPLEQALVAEAQILSSTWGKPPHLEALNNNVKHR